MKKCFICGKEAKHNETINVVTCECENCGTYAYEKNFLTTYDYYFSVNSKQKKDHNCGLFLLLIFIMCFDLLF